MSPDVPHFRRRPRASARLRVHYERAGGGSRRVQAWTHDIGLGGAFIECDAPPPAGTLIVVLVSVATAWEPLSLPASVCWVSDGHGRMPTGMGVRFDGLTSAQVVALYELIAAGGFGEGSAQSA